MSLKCYRLVDGLVEVIVLSSLPEEEVLWQTKVRAKEYYPPDTEPNFTIQMLTDDVQDGYCFFRMANKSDEGWWWKHALTKRARDNAARQVVKLKMIDPPFNDHILDVTDVTAKESFPDGTHLFVFTNPQGYEHSPLRGTFGIQDGELFFTVKHEGE